MQKRMVKSLRETAENVARMFSRPDRGGNYDNETFSVEKYVILSECTAAVVFHKEPTAKRAVAWFYFINSRAKPRWEYFFITYSHLVGLEHVGNLLHSVEQWNFEVTE